MFQIYVSELALIELDVELGKTFADTPGLGPCCPAHMTHLCQLVVLKVSYVFNSFCIEVSITSCLMGINRAAILQR